MKRKKKDTSSYMDQFTTFTYTRAQAFEDGVLFDLMDDAGSSQIVKEYYDYPVAFTAGVVRLMLSTNTTDDPNFDYSEFLIEVLSKGVNKNIKNLVVTPYFYKIEIQVNNEKQTHQMKIVCEPGDHGEPVIAILLSHED
ncbi:DUF6573 family protein [Leptospira santarosai]|uniref:DUF6573 family protein n=1 Tax=Leptospira santarosai TaxID=28183 RepID=UPI0024AECC4C|nr:DUF6573 family protein [Leptospira santarosai]MDI7175277.1 hypothetical protein [Leptospira santarosai]MDI7194955.1 hypothetical protein [Leptospira santarosai]MDO6399330.1 hypothetical protein [Leptospira santarosai]MDO6404796.1 hypothetical protein [Leptospira santarosai]